MAKISVESGDFGTWLVTHEDGRTILIQNDWDFPGLASTFGWSPSQAGKEGCECRGTDGTIRCPDCGTEVATFIDSACEFLHTLPDDVEDPGFFPEEEN